MTPKTDEKSLQNECIRLFKELGYKHIKQDEALNLRENDTNEVLLKPILKAKLEQINSFEFKGQRRKFSDLNIQKAINSLESNGELLLINQTNTEKITLGESFEENINGVKKSFSLKYIDFENIENNEFSISDEFSVLKKEAGIKSNEKHRRADIVVFINGIPIVIIELKKSSKSYELGVNQLNFYQEKAQIPQLFATAQICIAASYDAKYATIATPPNFYSLWREEDEDIKARTKKLVGKRIPTKLDENLVGLLSKERLLRLIKHYILFDKGVKKICRYQQFFACEKILQRVQIYEDGKRKGGLIWHTQGSGKSLTMVILTKLLKCYYPQSKIIIISDRIELDKQITDIFNNTDIKTARAKSANDLLEKLKSSTSVITTLVHKF